MPKTLLLAAVLLPAVSTAQLIDVGKPILQIGKADGDSAQILFGVWGASRQSNGSIIVMNSGTNELRVFDGRGVYVQTIGRKGRGPGEFTGLQAMDVIRGDTIVTYDVFLGRITWFTPRGQLARTIPVSPLGNGVLPRADAFLADGRMLAHTDFDRRFGKGLRRDTVTYVLYNAQGAPADTLGRYAGAEEFFLSTNEFSTRRPVIFGRGVFAHAEGNAMAVGTNDELSIDVFDARGRRTATVKEMVASVRVHKNDVDAANNVWLAGMRAEQRQRLQPRIKEFPARETRPAYQDLLLGRDGTLWTGDAGLPAAPRVFSVRLPGNRGKRQVRLPVGFFPLEAGTDYILGRVRDELGVEYVNVYRLAWK